MDKQRTPTDAHQVGDATARDHDGHLVDDCRRRHIFAEEKAVVVDQAEDVGGKPLTPAFVHLPVTAMVTLHLWAPRQAVVGTMTQQHAVGLKISALELDPLQFSQEINGM